VVAVHRELSGRTRAQSLHLPLLTEIPRTVAVAAAVVLIGVAMIAPASVATAASNVIASDGFSRHVRAGWGRAGVGGRWTLVGRRAAFRVSQASGVLRLERAHPTGGAVLRDARARDVDVSFQVRVGKAIRGGGVTVSAIGRKVDSRNEYVGRVTLLPDQRVALQLEALTAGVRRPLTRTLMLRRVRAGVGADLRIRLQVVGTAPARIRLKAWRAGTREPTWQLAATHRSRRLVAGGAVGFRATAGAPQRSLPLRVRLDDFAAVAMNRAQPRGPTISSVSASAVTPTSARITWTLSVPSTGQVEYGTTRSYGKRTKAERSFKYRTHVQELTSLQPGTRYHFRVRSANRSGQVTVSRDFTFTTTRHRTRPRPTPTATPRPTPTARPRATPTPRPNPTPTPKPNPTNNPAPASEIYGSGIAGDSKANKRVNNASVSHRFRASTTSDLQSIAFQQRGGDGYSDGNGGQMRISVQSDDGSTAHRPSGQVLAAINITPGNPGGDWTTYDRFTFPNPPRLVEGRLYHIVFENTGNSPGSNYISVNELFTFDQESNPRQPALSNDYGLLYDDGGWGLLDRYTPNMDLTYADGTHDGQAYIGIIIGSYGLIEGPDRMVRERFTVTGGDRRVTRAFVRVGQQSGSGALTIRLETGNGALIDQGAVAASQIPSFSPGSDSDNGDWVSVVFDQAHTLQNGQTYNLRLSSPDGTQYSMVPIRDGNDEAGGYMRSYAFRDGNGQKTTNGSSWQNLYQYSHVNTQFYLR
jgi:hypothetical protein